MMHVEYGISDISLRMPAIVGRNGIEYHVPIHLSSTAFRFFPTQKKIVSVSTNQDTPTILLFSII